VVPVLSLPEVSPVVSVAPVSALAAAAADLGEADLGPAGAEDPAGPEFSAPAAPGPLAGLEPAAAEMAAGVLRMIPPPAAPASAPAIPPASAPSAPADSVGRAVAAADSGVRGAVDALDLTLVSVDSSPAGATWFLAGAPGVLCHLSLVFRGPRAVNLSLWRDVAPRPVALGDVDAGLLSCSALARVAGALTGEVALLP
jgi:hypothetical protein